MLSLPVRVALSGVVAAVITDRPPYGYAVIVETPGREMPGSLVSTIDAPSAATPLPGRITLSCPAVTATSAWDENQTSFYLLYAHMQEIPPVKTGDTLTCGEQLGEVGTSGASVNPHLHLEVRAGPARARFDSLAHYTASASPGEMAAYCDWRVGGLFRPVDPLRLFTWKGDLTATLQPPG